MDDEDEIDDVEKDDKNKPSEVIDLTSPLRVEWREVMMTSSSRIFKESQGCHWREGSSCNWSPEPEADEGEDEKEDDKEASADDE